MLRPTCAHPRQFLFETLEPKTPLAVSMGVDGWTVVDPSQDTQIVYVSSSLGDDANDGLTQQTAKKTIASGKSLLRDGFPDWLLLKRGDVWVDEDFGDWSASGRSEQEPVLISAYGQGDRPLLKTTGNGINTIHNSISNIAIIGIHLYAYKRDPDSPDYDASAYAASGISWFKSGENFLIEDVYVDSYRTGMVIQNVDDDAASRNWRIRRSAIVDSYSTNSHSQGLYMHRLSDVHLEENLFDHNGWGNSRDAAKANGGATIFNHNIYVTHTNTNVTATGNIVARASSHGIQLRPGGTLENNLFLRNPISILVGTSLVPSGVDGIVNRNVILEGNDINSSNARGWAINLSYTRSNTMADNIAAHGISDPVNAAGLLIRSETGNPSRDILLQDNIFYDWKRGGPVIVGDEESATIVSEDNNFYYDHDPISGTNVDAAVVNWVDPNRSVATYNATLGGTSTFDAFIDEVRQQSKDNWRTEYTSQAVNDYIRAGFQIADNGPPVAGSDAVTIVEDSQQNPVTGNVLSNDSDPDNDTLSVVRVDNVASKVGMSVHGDYGTLLLQQDGSYSYTLDNTNATVDALAGGESLTESFSYTVWDGLQVASTTLTVNINGVTDPPRADFVWRSGDALMVGASRGSSFTKHQFGSWSDNYAWADFGTADVNGDGVDDVVGRAPNGDWWVGVGDGSGFVNAKWGEWSNAVSWVDVHTADVNGDGMDDIVGRANGNWWVGKSTGGAFVNELWGRWSPKASWRNVMSADVNGDGRSDIVGRIATNGAWWAAISSGTQFDNQPMGSWTTRLTWYDVQAADVDGDGLDDIVGRANGNWWVGRSTGAGFTNELWGTWSKNAQWLDVQVGDVDGDGKADILGRTNGQWWVARSNGQAFLNEHWGNWSATVDWLHVSVNDFNGDGNDDILGYVDGNWWVALSDSGSFRNELWADWNDPLADVHTGHYA